VRRVNVIGSSGSGKTSVGRAIAAKLGFPFIELDEIHWGRYPHWRMPADDEFRIWVKEATSGDRWVVDGSYSKARDIVWARADTIVWLEPPFLLRLWRVVRRTIGRMVTGEPLWGIQRETFRASFLSRDSLILFMLRTERRRSRVYREWLARPEYRHLEVVHLRSEAEIAAWLARL
jgi:adenylate kinase family enzyme